MPEAQRPTASSPHTDAFAYFALACAITWSLDAPIAFAWATHRTPAAWAMACAGFGAWGPTLAAVLVAARRHAVREVFSRWRVNPLWIALALAAPFLVRLPATLIDSALGGEAPRWFYLPDRPEYVAALVMFSFGEEFGWRGFAYPRLEARFGAVAGSLLLGAVWGLWHLGMMFTPTQGLPDPLEVAALMAYLALWSVIVAWLFESSGRSIAVAIAVHAGAHLDNVDRYAPGFTRLRALRFLVLALVAAAAARSLLAKKRAVATEGLPKPTAL